jgi:uncharacterized protein with GYD domain
VRGRPLLIHHGGSRLTDARADASVAAELAIREDRCDRPDFLKHWRLPCRYLGRFAYTSEAVKALVDNPQDRAKAAAEAAESLGAKLIGFWHAFGEFDGVFLVEAPDNATVALAMLAGASGALAKTETTVLLTMDETLDAMRKAGGAAFRPPS